MGTTGQRVMPQHELLRLVCLNVNGLNAAPWGGKAADFTMTMRTLRCLGVNAVTFQETKMTQAEEADCKHRMCQEWWGKLNSGNVVES